MQFLLEVRVYRKEGNLFKEMVYEHPSKHGGEEESRIVMVDIEHPAHRPERNIVQSPSKEEPGGSAKGLLPGFLLLRRFLPTTLLLEACPGVHCQEDEQEDNVAPPGHLFDQRVLDK